MRLNELSEEYLRDVIEAVREAEPAILPEIAAETEGKAKGGVGDAILNLYRLGLLDREIRITFKPGRSPYEYSVAEDVDVEEVSDSALKGVEVTYDE